MRTIDSRIRIGYHVSIRDGYAKAAKTAYDSGCGAYQYFPKNPRSLKLKDWNAPDAGKCREFCREHGLRSIAHSAYPVNLAVEPGGKREAVAAAVVNDLAIAESCGSDGVVVHFGKYTGEDVLHGYHLVLDTLNEILRKWEGNALVLLENQAGEGTRIGMTLEEAAQIRKLCIRPEQIGFCLDTCHAFASGIWNGHNWRELREAGDQADYFPHLKAVHLNDSVYACGSGRDRHAVPGFGQIGASPFRELFGDPYIRSAVCVMETSCPLGVTPRQELERIGQWME